MALLGALSNLRDSERGQIILALMLKKSPVLRFFDKRSAWQEMATDFFFRPVDGGGIALQRRSLGGNYTSTTMTPSAKQDGGLAMAGFQIDIDQTHIADDERGLADLKAWISRELPIKADTFAASYENELFLGSGAGSPRQLTGLRTQLNGTTAPGGFTDTMVRDAEDAVGGSAVSLDLTDPDNYDPFIEYMQIIMQEVEDLAGIMLAPKLHAKMTTIARKFHMYSQTTDQFGKLVEQFNGIDLVPTLDSSITLTEPDAAETPANVTTSLYLISPGENRVGPVTNSGLDWEDHPQLESKQSGRMKAEIRSEMVIQQRNVIRRVRRIKV